MTRSSGAYVGSELLPTELTEEVWIPTKIERRGDALGIGIERATFAARPRRLTAQPLQQFCKLADYTGGQLAERVLAFARTYGPFDFCQCGKPWPCDDHNIVTRSAGPRRTLSSRVVNGRHTKIQIVKGQIAGDWQAAEWYGETARLYNAIRNMAWSLQQNQMPEPNDRVTFLRLAAPHESPERWTPARLREMVEAYVNGWLIDFQCALQLDWSHPQAAVRIAQVRPSARIMYALALELYAAAEPMVLCGYGCKVWITGRRRPPSGQLPCCGSNECKRKRNRLAKQRERANSTPRQRKPARRDRASKRERR